MRAEIRAMLAQRPRGGAIVNTASVNGLGASPCGGPYSAAKAAVIALSKSAALDYADSGIRVNAFVPGTFKTRMLEHVFKVAGGSDEGAAQVEAAYRARVPLGRIGDPREAAEAAVWLLSDKASYVTGASFIVDGGLTSFAR
jgi:NAD(P)-dependent dehydrogenase (short-subunit alcohol dehydrogenase family)